MKNFSLLNLDVLLGVVSAYKHEKFFIILINTFSKIFYIFVSRREPK